MNLTGLALSNRTATLVAVLLVVLFGSLSLLRLPIQLSPIVERPSIRIGTSWSKAAAEEVESNIVERQEKALSGLPGMTKLVGTAYNGTASLSLEFSADHDLKRGLLDVITRLNGIRLPDDAGDPRISTSRSGDRAAAWFMVTPEPGNDRPIASYLNYVEDIVLSRLERVPGVSKARSIGGDFREVRITFDPYKTAMSKIGLLQAIDSVSINRGASGGNVDIGKRSYVLRFSDSFDLDELGDTVIEWRDGRSVRLRDVADIEIGTSEKRSFALNNGTRAMGINVYRESGANVLKMMSGVKDTVADLGHSLAQQGIRLKQTFDETTYIYRSIDMLRNNLGLGILLSIAALWWFLRKFSATMVVAAAIPISLLATFSGLDIAGRSLNIISLAGMAFAVGLTLDASIVVLENIVRLRERGMGISEAVASGPVEVQGALVASALTTIAIFLPVIFLSDETGQLFGELALAISVAVAASTLIALTMIPAAASRWLSEENLRDAHRHWWQWMTRVIMRATDNPIGRFGWIVSLIATPIVIGALLIPRPFLESIPTIQRLAAIVPESPFALRAGYLPSGKREYVFVSITPPSGINAEHLEKEVISIVVSRLQPYVTGEKEPRIDNYHMFAFSGNITMGVRPGKGVDMNRLISTINQALRGIPGTNAFVYRGSLLGGSTGSKSITVDIQSRDIEKAAAAAQRGVDLIEEILPDADVRLSSNLNAFDPELRMTPDKQRLIEVGLSSQSMIRLTGLLGDGERIGDYFDGEDSIPIYARIPAWKTLDELGAIPLATPAGEVVPIGDLVRIERTTGPAQIKRLDSRRTVSLSVRPPDDMNIEEVIETIRTRAEPYIRLELPASGDVLYGDTASKLENSLGSLSSGFLLAVTILFLLMAALFRSFLDSFYVLLALPLATAGGLIAILGINTLFGTRQSVDLLTMIGFIILLGLVVNNAILLVLRTRTLEREGLARRDAVSNAISGRLRPIFMSTLTSVFGMLPLLIFPGAGTELYRGLAMAIVGGICFGTVFTLILLPSLLRIGEEKNSALEPAVAAGT
ncbi:efflux RND transporter permease subunit [Thioalkalivibrio sp. HK1]|uniref:efflux RND transporter permease subunit n=1 Tax=Thioalkalivibrio sp. HK1 TaxID=1469245 RepID=UPI0004702E1D|nr:efflux RND transporter permease subunit [Thioalkalivibrio sp. HK1]